MKKIIFLIPVLIFAQFYSIQLFTAKKNQIKALENYYNKLPSHIRDLCVIYETQKGYLTIRYMLSDKIKTLKPYTKKFKNFSIVKNDEKKIKKLFIQKFKQNKNLNLLEMLLKYSLLQIKTSEIVKQIPKKTKKQKTKKPKHEKLPQWLKMSLALHSYDKEKISNLLNKKVFAYQKIEAYDKLQNYDLEAGEIFHSYSKDYAYTLLEAIKKRKKYIKFTFKTKKNTLYTNNYKTIEVSNGNFSVVAQNSYISGANDSSAQISFKNASFLFRHVNSKNIIGANYSKTFRHTKFVFGINQISNDSDTLQITSKKNLAAINYSYAKYSNIFNINAEIARYTDLSSDKLFDRFYFNLSFNKKMLNFLHTLYLKNVNYTDQIPSYTESGYGITVGSTENYLKYWKFYGSFFILYNTNTKTGYIIKIGADKSVIRIDNLNTYFQISKNSLTGEKELEFLIDYIYFF